MATAELSLIGAKITPIKDLSQEETTLNISQQFLSVNDETLENFSIDLEDDDSAYEQLI